MQIISDSIEDCIRAVQNGVITMIADTCPVRKPSAKRRYCGFERVSPLRRGSELKWG